MTKTAEKIQNFIEGQFVEPLGGRYLDNIEPATGKPYSQVADSDARDVDLAVAAAEKAFVEWSRTSATDRSRILCALPILLSAIGRSSLAPSRSTLASRCRSRARWTFPEPPAIFVFSRPQFSTPNRKHTLPITSRSITRFVSRAALRD